MRYSARGIARSVLIALLAVNAITFAIRGSAAEALDAAAWLVLLLLFELETSAPSRLHGATAARWVIRGMRLGCAGAIALSTMRYARSGELLDAANSALWIAVVCVLEAEVRLPRFVATHRRLFSISASLLYAALGVLVLIWVAAGEWFDAYDALLWLVAFVMLELDVLRKSAARQHGREADQRELA